MARFVALLRGVNVGRGNRVPMAEFHTMIADNPLAHKAPDASRLLVVFTQNTGTLQDLDSLASLVHPPEQFHIGTHAAYLHCPDGILESPVAKALLGKTGAAATTRNWATVLKLAALLNPG